MTGYRPGYEIQNLQLCGVTAINAKTATIPDSVAISYEWYVVKAPVTDAQYIIPLRRFLFPASSLTDIIFPTTIRNVSINTEGTVNVRKYHFRSGGTVFQLLQWCRHQNQHLCSKRISPNLPRCTWIWKPVVRSETPATPVKVNVRTRYTCWDHPPS